MNLSTTDILDFNCKLFHLVMHIYVGSYIIYNYTVMNKINVYFILSKNVCYCTLTPNYLFLYYLKYQFLYKAIYFNYNEKLNKRLF